MAEMTTAVRRHRLPARRSGTVGKSVPGTSVEGFLAAQMRIHSATPRRSKRSAARLALVAAMREGYLGPGAMLPSEKALTAILDVSLGTVQAALRQLQQSGTIIRRRGDGSRVASVEPLSDSIWHFRFIDKATGHPLRFVRQVVEVDRVTGAGPWTEFLGDCSSVVRIRRRMTMSDGSLIHAEMYLDERVVTGLADIDPQELEMVNIRPYLEETFGLFTAGARHTIRTTKPGRRAAADLGLEPGQRYFEIHAKAFTAERAPAYFQRIFALCADCVLDF